MHLALSTKESTDYTAIVSGEVGWENGKLSIYVQPHLVFRQMKFSETMEALETNRPFEADERRIFRGGGCVAAEQGFGRRCGAS
ncbi:MAG: hypothetical protein ACLQB4_18075 [Beijerinckiaceae bacterium]